MTSKGKNAWWRELGAISQGMLLLDGHIVTPPPASPTQPPDVSAAAAAPDGPAQRRDRQARQDGYAKRVREMTALSLFR